LTWKTKKRRQPREKSKEEKADVGEEKDMEQVKRRKRIYLWSYPIEESLVKV
jgi:hypothetical protein